jgi:hypothetical protein
MIEQIKDILSDSTLLELVANGIAEVKVKTYNDKKLLLKFEEYYAVQTKPSWTKEDVIDGLILTDESEFLKSTLEELAETSENNDDIKSYQFVDGFNDILCEIIAKKLTITQLE